MLPMPVRCCSAPYKPRCKRLPPEQRDVFVAHEIEGLSFADMSAQWRVPQNTLLARKRYAVLALRAQLQAEYGDLIV